MQSSIMFLCNHHHQLCLSIHAIISYVMFLCKCFEQRDTFYQFMQSSIMSCFYVNVLNKETHFFLFLCKCFEQRDTKRHIHAIINYVFMQSSSSTIFINSCNHQYVMFLCKCFEQRDTFFFQLNDVNNLFLLIFKLIRIFQNHIDH